MPRNLDLTALRAFVTVAETGGVTRAAGLLNLTQSAVSMQLKRLEESLGQPLLDRAGRSIKVTAQGEQVLGFIGISMPAFRIAGGILLFLTALDMLFDRRTRRRKGQADAAEEDEGDDPSIFPLAIPLIAGPGSITTVILLVGERPGPEGLALVIGVMLSVIALALALFLMGGLLERALGRVGINVVTRLLGMLLAALAVQFVLDGLRGFGLAG